MPINNIISLKCSDFIKMVTFCKYFEVALFFWIISLNKCLVKLDYKPTWFWYILVGRILIINSIFLVVLVHVGLFFFSHFD